MSEELKTRAVCHACASQPRAWLCPVCDNELTAIKAGQGEAVAWINNETLARAHEKFGSYYLAPVRSDEDDTPLYTAPPATADAVSVPRELLSEMVELHEWRGVVLMVHMDELRDLLAQSQGAKP